VAAPEGFQQQRVYEHVCTAAIGPDGYSNCDAGTDRGFASADGPSY
jgi:hypothetical protein